MFKKVKTVPRLMFEIRPSLILPSQVATFAVRNIKRGEVVADFDSPEEVVLISRRDLKKLDSRTRAQIHRFCLIDEDDYYCVPADLNNIGSSWYFNHSCDPNVGYDRYGNFVALRNIRKDEELFLDYGQMLTGQDASLKCSCGAFNCRRLVTGQDWLNPEFHKKNKESMWPGMRKLPSARKKIR